MKRLGGTTKWFLVMGLALTLLTGWGSAGMADEAKDAAAPAPEKPQWNAGVDFLSQYLWRGIALSRRSGVIQPSFTGSYKGVSFNAWFNFDTGEQNPYGRDVRRGFTWNETDLTFSYTREIFPNLLNNLVVVATLEVGRAILLEAALSFLGMGVQPPTPSWGLMISEGKEFMLFDPYLISIPGVALFILVLGMNLLGDGLRDVTAPEGNA